MKRKKCYETPLITQAQVELEDAVCGTPASGDPMPSSNVTLTATEHENGTTFDCSDSEIYEWEKQ